MRGSVRAVAATGTVVALSLLGACSHKVNPDTTLQAGLVQQQAGNFDTAAADYQAVLSVREGDKYALYNLGLIAQTQSHFDEAEAFYRQSLVADDAFVPALFNLAILRVRAGATQEAIGLYGKVVAAEPTNAKAWFNQALLLQQVGQDAKAAAGLRRALRLDPPLASRLVTPLSSPGASP